MKRRTEMKKWISMVLIFAFPAFGSEVSNCANNSSLPGKNEMMEKFVARHYGEFRVKFEELCAQHRSALACHRERIEGESVKAQMSALTNDDPCAEAFQVPLPHGGMIYSITDR